MKLLSLAVFATLLLALPAAQLNSQSTPAADPSALLLQLKASNDALIEHQAATLKVMAEMEKDAQQLRIFTKRG